MSKLYIHTNLITENTSRQFSIGECFLCDDDSYTPPLVRVIGLSLIPCWIGSERMGHNLHLHVEVIDTGDEFTVLPEHLFKPK